MSDLINPNLFTHDATIPEGAAALVFSTNGDVRIAHNIASVRETGMMQGPEITPILFALSALEMVEDEPAFARAITRAVNKLKQLEGPDATTISH